MGGDDIWLYMSAPGGWARIGELFADIGGTYRPIPFSLFAVYHWFGSNVGAMHWVPMVLHAANVVLVYLLARHLSRSKVGAIVAALVYGVSHIVFFDVFTLTGLVDQVFLLFSLGSIWALLRYFEVSKYQLGWAALTWILFILAMFCKESFVSVLLVISYLLWRKRENLKHYLAFWGPTAAYFGFKLLLYRQQGAAYSYVIEPVTLGRNLFDYGLWLINWRHGWQMGMPYPPHPYYDWVSLAYAGLIGAAAWSLWRHKRELFGLAFWWGLVGLLPFYFLGRALPFYLEFSLIGIVIVIAGGVSVMKHRWLYAVTLAGLALYMSVTTKAQWVTHSFSARGVQAAEQYQREVVAKHDWSQYDELCLQGMKEYELWATGVGQLVNMMGYPTSVVINQACGNIGTLSLEYKNEHYGDQ